MIGLSVFALSACSSPTVPPEEQPPFHNGPSYSIDFGGTNAYTVTPGHVLAIHLKIQRDEGFEGPIELSATDTPGVVVIFRPETVLHREESDLLVVADQSTARRTHLIEFTARSEGHPTRTAVLSLTVVDPK
jgi:hypothetical protein